MTERLNMGHLRERALNVNRRLVGTGRAVVVEQRNGHVGLDEYSVVTEYLSGAEKAGQRLDSCLRTIMCGTKREVGEFLHAMMVGIDLSRS